MFKKLLSILAMSSFLLVSSSLCFAQSKDNWSSVQGLVNQEVAVKTKSGMKYGIIKSVDNDGLVLQLADKKRLTQDETTFNRTDIKKIWRALLFVNNRNIGKGALIGAGVGAVALGVPAITQGQGNDQVNDGLAGVGFFIGALGGAVVGGIVGFVSKTKHKKRDLIYKQ